MVKMKPSLKSFFILIGMILTISLVIYIISQFISFTSFSISAIIIFFSVGIILIAWTNNYIRIQFSQLFGLGIAMFVFSQLNTQVTNILPTMDVSTDKNIVQSFSFMSGSVNYVLLGALVLYALYCVLKIIIAHTPDDEEENTEIPIKLRKRKVFY